MSQLNKFKRYTITSALPYANGPLHIGHLAGAYLPADIYTRYLRLMGKDVVFVCGSDEHGAAIIAVPAKETVKLSTGNNMIESTPSREQVWVAQTPQAFKFSILYSAHERARADKMYGTDESSLVERIGMSVKLIEGTYDNIKITTPEDLALAELIVRRQKNG